LEPGFSGRFTDQEVLEYPFGPFLLIREGRSRARSAATRGDASISVADEVERLRRRVELAELDVGGYGLL
jgi:hypothetical protein